MCAYCRSERATTLDHFEPLVREQRPTPFCNDYWNQVPCCMKCNCSKRNLAAAEWLRLPHGPLRLLRKAERVARLRRWDGYARLFLKKCQRKRVQAAWWRNVQARIDTFFEDLDDDVARHRAGDT